VRDGLLIPLKMHFGWGVKGGGRIGDDIERKVEALNNRILRGTLSYGEVCGERGSRKKRERGEHGKTNL